KNDTGGDSKARLPADNMMSKTWRVQRLIEARRDANTSRGSSSRRHGILRVALEERNAGNRRLEQRHRLHQASCSEEHAPPKYLACDCFELGSKRNTKSRAFPCRTVWR